MSRFWEFIKNQQNDEEVELRISGEIVDDDDAWIYEWFGIPVASPNSFRNELSKHKGKSITVWIDSYGGNVFAAAGIYNALKEHKGKVVTVIDGKAMSAASVIAMAGEEVRMSPVGMMMIHNPWTDARGEAKDMRHAADVLDEVKETIVNAYQIRTGKPRDQISEMMDNETFMSAKTALKEGFIDTILYSESKGQPIENNFVFSHMAIQNSVAETMKKFLEIAKSAEQKDTAKGAASGTATPQPVANIKTEGNEGMDIKTVTDLENAFPQLVEDIKAAAKAEGVKEERERLKVIDEISKNIDPELVSKAKYEEPMSAEKLAIEALKADNRKGREYLDDAEKDAEDSKANDVKSVPADNKDKAKLDDEKGKAAEDIAEIANKRRGTK